VKRAVALLAGALVLAAAAQAGQGIPEAIAARPRPHPAFGWFTQLDASCWSGRESNGGAPSVYGYRFVDGGRGHGALPLALHTREGFGISRIGRAHLFSGAKPLTAAANRSCACADTGPCLMVVVAGYLPR
jgi:hypothetical protein